MDKATVKMLILSALSLPMILFRNSAKYTFGFGVLIEIINTYWDKGWDTFAAKAAGKKLMRAVKDDPADDLIDAFQKATGGGGGLLGSDDETKAAEEKDVDE